MTTHSRFALSLGLAFGASVISSAVLAQQNFRQHDAHTHGHVEFNIAQDGHELLIEITAPGADVVGFEHQPKNAEQQQRVSDAIEQLNQANSIFELSSAAQCQIKTTSVHQSLAHDEPNNNHDHHAKHDEADTHKDHHDHHHEHEDHHDSHGTFTVTYHYHCDVLARLKRIETQWFRHFPNTNTISVNLLTDNAQTTTELSADKAVIAL